MSLNLGFFELHFKAVHLVGVSQYLDTNLFAVVDPDVVNEDR